MDYSPRTRDRFRLAVSATTAVATSGALTVTGWLAAVIGQDHLAEQSARAELDAREQANWASAARRAARQQARYDAAMARRQSRAARPHLVLRERPSRTRVTLRYVQAAPLAAAGPGPGPGPGGSVTRSPAFSPGAAAGASRPPGGQQPAPPPPPPPAPPPPPPAPTSGS